jgi:hypothetical protein
MVSYNIIDGQIRIEPPLNPEEIRYLQKFHDTRRMVCEEGPYYVDRPKAYEDRPIPIDLQWEKDAGILDFNTPPDGQPGLWCRWLPTKDGRAIECDTGPSFFGTEHSMADWMQYLIDHFIGHAALAKPMLPFLQRHTLNGEIYVSGEALDDHWKITVEDNRVSVASPV